ncbi:MAG: hypothetical protein D6737_19385 [Chloroflexi bacterium]|nr:MAG: hypothetical protein D6737_19385 [Chloroflexota bacterium]
MKLFVLTGLVSIEKAQFAVDLARQTTRHYTTVAIIDNLSRASITQKFYCGDIIRITGDLSHNLADTILKTGAEVIVLAASETLRPDELLLTLDRVRDDMPQLAVQIIALIDDRTCECFPVVQEQLEQYADMTVRAPFDAHSVLEMA